MYLTREQERILSGEEGWVKAKALRVIVKVGEALGADELVKIRHAHVSGISYTNIGEPGLKFLEELAENGAEATVYTTSNPTCIDLAGESSLIDQGYLDQQLLVNKALEKMKIKPTYTCLPYMLRPPSPHEHLTWGESNAVAMANSFYGARTNREGGPIALLASITGYIYNAGLHKLEERCVKTLIKYEDKLDDLTASLLGLWIGENIDEIPMIELSTIPRIQDVKLLLASAAATGSHALIVIKGLTPLKTYIEDINDKITIRRKDLIRTYKDNIWSGKNYSLAYIGCPHLSATETLRIIKLLEKKYDRTMGKIILSIPPLVSSLFRKELEALRNKNIEVITGTCPVVARFKYRPDIIVTNSGKAFFYLRKLHRLDVRLASLNSIIG
ncbi:MAG: DUF521 domain-containing protein [Crenarchaeota archaeon]|nr:DUF521 domain-containing protein [Thermoproteota archaeon]